MAAIMPDALSGIATVLQILAAAATVALAVFAYCGLRQIDPMIEANRHAKSRERARFATDLLAMFAKEIVPLELDWIRQVKQKRLEPYTGPVDPEVFDTTFAVADNEQARLAREKAKLPGTLPLLNELELFAAAVLLGIGELGIEEQLVEEGDLYRPTAWAYVRMVNELWDVVLVYSTEYSGLYSNLRRLYARWDPCVSRGMYEHYEDLDAMGVGRRFKKYHVTSGRPKLVEGRWYCLVAVQAIDPDGEGIPGWPVWLSFNRAHEEDEARVGTEFLTHEPKMHIANSSGAVFVDVRSAVGRGPVVRVHNPLDPRNILEEREIVDCAPVQPGGEGNAGRS